MYDIIAHKRDGKPLSDPEIDFFVAGVTDGSIPDYQISALLMAIVLQGMDDRETARLTDRMAHSGEMIDLSPIEGFKVDKHSTGGVGDKTTLIVAPIVAACGVRVAKMSGRGLGHTGGTIDKLEAIPGFSTALPPEQFFEIVSKVGVAVAGQSGNLAPADKKLYALRDVTATVESIPLIAASIMSKKLASGADGIVLDVKCGSGAFMKTQADATRLAETMVAIGEANGRRVVALITDMDCPLGTAIGNSLEVIEAVETLRGHGPADLTEVSLALAANMLWLAMPARSLAECHQLAAEALESGRAFETLVQMVAAQGGDTAVLYDPTKFLQAAVQAEIFSPTAGYLAKIDTNAVGMASMLLGAGRATKEETIDFAAGIRFPVRLGEWVEAGQPIATFYTNRPAALPEATERFLSALTLTEAAPTVPPLIYARVEHPARPTESEKSH